MMHQGQPLNLQPFCPSDLSYPQERPQDHDIPAHVTCVLDVNLGAIQSNYKALQSLVGPRVTVVPVIKANAYGFGVEPVAQALWAIGAHSFFVADVNEGLSLRHILPQATIYLLAGVWEGIEKLCEEHSLIPVLIHKHQIMLWQAWARHCHKNLPALLHVDTGIHRTGLKPQDIDEVYHKTPSWEGIELKGIISHLACTAEPDHLMNMQQLRLFQKLKALWPDIPASLSGSGGIFLGPSYHFDFVRPGMVLYGLRAHSMTLNEPLQPCLRIAARILQVHHAAPGETVGYNATHRCSQPTRIATVALGYADGYLRPLSNQGVAMLHGHVVPIIGRISMDLLTVDISQIPESWVHPGQWVDIVNEHISVHEVAQRAHTIPYEVLVRLGPRYHRRYYL